LSYLELIAVVTVLGIVSAIAVGRLGPGALCDAGSQTDARRLALDLLATQRAAIATGANHYLLFANAAGSLYSYQQFRVQAGGDVAVDETRTFTNGLTVTGNSDRAEFTFSGAALDAYTYTLTAPGRRWQVTVVPATGAVRVVNI
jgi:hypothetical protein